MQWNLSGAGPVYIQLAYAIKTAIARGELIAGSRIPGVRELAAEAAVNPNTMQRAIMLLQDEGLVATERTAGSFVTEDGGKISVLAEELGLEMARRYLADLRLIGRQDEAENLLDKAREAENGQSD